MYTQPFRAQRSNGAAHAFAAVLAVCFAFASGGTNQAHAQNAPRGLAFARTYCAMCHSIDKYSASPLRIAPPFRDLHNRYPVESLEQSLAEGITTGHPSMPQFRLDLGQIRDLIAFLKTLE